MLLRYFPIIRNYVLSVSLQRKYNFYHQNALLDAFRTNSRNMIGRNPSMVIPLLANQNLTPMLLRQTSSPRYNYSKTDMSGRVIYTMLIRVIIMSSIQL